MKRPGLTRFWTARILVIACLVPCTVPLAAKQADPAVPNSEIRGRVTGTDGKPASGARNQPTKRFNKTGRGSRWKTALPLF